MDSGWTVPTLNSGFEEPLRSQSFAGGPGCDGERPVQRVGGEFAATAGWLASSRPSPRHQHRLFSGGQRRLLSATPPGNILDTFHIDLTGRRFRCADVGIVIAADKYARGNGQTSILGLQAAALGRPIALDVLGVAPIDRLGELTWLGPASVVVFGFFCWG